MLVLLVKSIRKADWPLFIPRLPKGSHHGSPREIGARSSKIGIRSTVLPNGSRLGHLTRAHGRQCHQQKPLQRARHRAKHRARASPRVKVENGTGTSGRTPFSPHHQPKRLRTSQPPAVCRTRDPRRSRGHPKPHHNFVSELGSKDLRKLKHSCDLFCCVWESCVALVWIRRCISHSPHVVVLVGEGTRRRERRQLSEGRRGRPRRRL